MVKLTFIASITTLLLFAAKTRAVCILYTPNALTGIVNEQEFEVHWVGCVVSVCRISLHIKGSFSAPRIPYQSS